MRKWVTLGLVAAASLGFASSSSADVPSALTSSVICSCVADGLGGASTQAAANKCTISPRGGIRSEDLIVAVTVRNVLSAALAGSTVNATAAATGVSTFIWDNGVNPPEAVENPQTGVSNGAGQVTFTFDEGGVTNNPTPTLPNLNFSVTAQGPGPGSAVTLQSCSPQYSIVGYDSDASGAVALPDFGTFAGDFGAGNLRSDFNWDGGVGLPDFGFFAGNFGATIDGQ
jgi:hypothetical protein